MNLNIDAILQAVQDWRGQLEDWGVNNQSLYVIGVVAAVLFLLSLREVSAWYFKINKIRDEVRELRGQMSDLQILLRETRDSMRGATGPLLTPMKPDELLKIASEMRDGTDNAALKKKDVGSPTTKFRFDH